MPTWWSGHAANEPRLRQAHMDSVYSFSLKVDWTLREHAAFWTAAIHVWPALRGRRATRETLGLVTHLMERDGLSAEEIAKHLGLKTDTVRRRIKEGLAIYSRGAEYCDLGACIRRQVGTLVDDAPPLPRVYRRLEKPPTWTYFNSLIGDPPALGRSIEAEQYKDRGTDLLRQRWSSNR